MRKARAGVFLLMRPPATLLLPALREVSEPGLPAGRFRHSKRAAPAWSADSNAAAHRRIRAWDDPPILRSVLLQSNVSAIRTRLPATVSPSRRCGQEPPA